ncbi:B12-binding domain-containing radical SAM protein [Dactylosporangium sp. CA-233914]|uniref:B12-binding domain-containing radical SAM protein n=1 Tax=Dactylosporangium sp. CA-233914 TaxID=3239934 RepID=UPI003D8E9AA5
MTYPRVLVWTPTLYELGFKQHHIDGEALAVQASLQAAGYDSVLLDAYYRGRPAASLAAALADGEPFDVVVAHLFTSDTYGPRLRAIADELRDARRGHGVTVIGFGPLAVSAADDLAAHGAVDEIVAAAAYATALPGQLSVARRRSDDPVQALVDHLGRHLAVHTPLDNLGEADLGYRPDAVVSVTASRGCRSRCKFCAYNADLPGGGWVDLPIRAAVADIAFLHQRLGATAFAFTDSDFGGTQPDCTRRAAELRAAVRDAGLSGAVTFAISVRPETLTAASIEMLAEAGVRTMLIGVESFNPDTLHRLYGKRQDLAHLQHVVAVADAAGVTVVGSYILWHPWQTLPGLAAEIAALDEFGRYRVPQFMARSRLHVVPGTVIERQIRNAGLLDERPFHRAFRIADPAAAALNADLQHWFTTNAAPVIDGLHERQPEVFHQIGALKTAEWAWLTGQVTDRLQTATHG